MQTIILSEQESEQSQSTVNVRNPVGTLIFGLFLGLLILFFDRRNQPHALVASGERASGWGRSLVIFVAISLTIFVLINLILGP